MKSLDEICARLQRKKLDQVESENASKNRSTITPSTSSNRFDKPTTDLKSTTDVNNDNNNNNNSNDKSANNNNSIQRSHEDASNAVIYFKEYDPSKNRFKSAVKYSPISAEILQSPLRLIAPIEPISGDDQPSLSAMNIAQADNNEKGHRGRPRTVSSPEMALDKLQKGAQLLKR
ncbi:unnamed protein product [Toxocara canis]|uniref:Serine/threonine-protein kinase DDB_G0282963 n=1 Tax=Toxocara canis TaxID=6265 RepID=A0A183UKC9_TOXCA|nr:unnamed protein product [Toxocara canis]